MQKEHRERIQRNFSSLVEQTDLDLMVTALFEKGVFSDIMMDPYRDATKDARSRKRFLYREITRRGPEAFANLLESLSENGYWDLVRDLDPTSALHTRITRAGPSQAGDSAFLSLSGTRQKTNTGKEQNDPNRNNASQSASHIADIKTPRIDQNGAGSAELARCAGDEMATIPRFNVIKSQKFFEDVGKDIKLYRTRGRLRGVLVLFSYAYYRANIEEARRGAEVDAVNLRYLFTELGFKVLSYPNLSLPETKSTLSSLKDVICGECPETVFIVFSSHGYQRGGSGDNDIRCSDGGLISFYDIIQHFNNERFPALRGVPKVFIFQMCRGSNADLQLNYAARPLREPRARAEGARAGRPLVTDGGTPYTDDDEDIANNRLYSDILIAHSTVPGYVSYRDQEKGSCYIQALCAVFAARAHDTHVEDLLTLADGRLGALHARQTSSVDRWGFNKRLYLHPGLHEH